MTEEIFIYYHKNQNYWYLEKAIIYWIYSYCIENQVYYLLAGVTNFKWGPREIVLKAILVW